jgi:hypothetical protein
MGTIAWPAALQILSGGLENDIGEKIVRLVPHPAVTQ